MLLLWGVLLLLIAAIPYVVFLGLTAGIQPSGSPAEKTETVEPVSIVLPTYNEEDIVEQTLHTLCEVDYPASELEIVVVDSSEDETANRVREFFATREAPRHNVIEEEDRGGVARAVNRGVSAASHDIIFRTDCDARIHENAIREAVENLQDDRIGGVTGRQVDVLGGSAVEESYRSMQARNHATESHLDSVFMVHGPCFAFEKQLFEELPDDTIADDTEIAVRLRKQGKRIVMDPAMRFTEVGVSDLWGRRKRKDRRAMGLLQVLWRHRDLVGRYGRYGRVVVPFNWWFLAISPWFTIGGGVLILLGLLMTSPLIGVVAIVGMGLGIALGQRDMLGPLGPPYAVFDSHLSLVIGGVKLWRGAGDGTWSIDETARETFQE